MVKNSVNSHEQSAAEDFIAKWRGVTASELSTSQSFLIDLCGLLRVDAPHATAEKNYMFERPITFVHGDGSTSSGRIDLYRRGSFVLESKKLRPSVTARGFDDAMLRARSQAEAYSRALPANDGRPPFLLVVEVGTRIELYSEFSRSGATYTPFPDPRSHRIALEDLRDPRILDRLRRVWLTPLSLDPSRESARVTRSIAMKLGALARSLEQTGHSPESVAQFLMRCLFTMFAEDVKLLPPDSFRDLLSKYADEPKVAVQMLEQLWHDMDGGGFSAAIAADVLRFNGKLFKQPDVIPLNKTQLALLIDAARADWKHVEPAIFGTLLERALLPEERHKLGAHFTPRAYVERLVLPTVIEPLRVEWSNVQAAAYTLISEGKHDPAVTEVRQFHHRLCSLRVLDPACGSGNFLYVTLEHLKRLEGEVLNTLDELGFRQTGLALTGDRAQTTSAETVDPHNLLGLEINPRAAAIAEVVLWIGYLQWHFRTRGDIFPPLPVIRDFRNIENRDALLAFDGVQPEVDADGAGVTRWDGITYKVHPISGESVPDETARLPQLRYLNPRKAVWPDADFIVGNPPFIGDKRLRFRLGDGYVEALRTTWPEVPESAEFVMNWWYAAALKVARGETIQFGFITTNSIRQVFNRSVLDHCLKDASRPIHLSFAIPDHPWIDSADGASVRIAMTVGASGNAPGTLASITSESPGENGEVDIDLTNQEGLIHADLRIGADVASAVTLCANEHIAFRGVTILGEGFWVEPTDPLVDLEPGALRILRNGKDITDTPRGVSCIDFFGLTQEQARARFPRAFQRVLDRVKPERDVCERLSYREKWWIFAEPRPDLRAAIANLRRYIATPMTAKHRVFVMLDAKVVADQGIIAIALDDFFHLGVLSSCVHTIWSMAAGGTLEDRPRYNQTRCFETFPFPDNATGLTLELEERIRSIAGQLDTHRAARQSENTGLTLTGIYNVLSKQRSGSPLTAKDRRIHDQGLISVLAQLHDELDAAVLESYGWSDLQTSLRTHNAPGSISNEVTGIAGSAILLQRLVKLNAARAMQETLGAVHFVRPNYRTSSRPLQQIQADLASIDRPSSLSRTTRNRPQPWPRDTLDQVRALADVLTNSAIPLSLEDITKQFAARGPWKQRLPQLLEVLVALGRAKLESGRYRAA